MGLPALVLDFGGPVLLTPFELAADRPGTPENALLFERGPLATTSRPDLAWQDLQAGLITEVAYWADRAQDLNESGGGVPDIRAMIARIYEPARPDLVRQEARKLVQDAQAAGHPVAILSNDMYAFHSKEWIERMEIVAEVDLVVDGSIEGHLKPDPRLYELLAERLERNYGDLVFLDDQRVNIAGAEALGIPSVWFDVNDTTSGYDAVRFLLGLSSDESGDHDG